jgi:hypothetical protein
MPTHSKLCSDRLSPEWCLRLLLFFFLIVGDFSCATDTPTAINPSDKLLQVEEVEVTDVWLKVNLPPSVTQPLTLYRNGRAVLSFPQGPVDTTVVDNSLSPKHGYTYTLSYLGSLGLPVSTVNVTTMDTTSHNIEWHIDTIAGGWINDVAIINDSLVYAVGDLFTKDSVTMLDTVPWNTAVWNGRSWSLNVVWFQDPPNSPYYCKCELEGILSMTPSQILMTGGMELIQWNGISVNNYSYAQTSIQHLWAMSPTSIYGVGRGGGISCFNGVSWSIKP